MSKSANEIQEWLIEKVSENLEISADEIDVRKPFTALGMGSAEASILMGELEEFSGQRLSVTLLWDYPSIEALSAYIAEQSSKAA